MVNWFFPALHGECFGALIRRTKRAIAWSCDSSCVGRRGSNPGSAFTSIRKRIPPRLEGDLSNVQHANRLSQSGRPVLAEISSRFECTPCRLCRGFTRLVRSKARNVWLAPHSCEITRIPPSSFLIFSGQRIVWQTLIVYRTDGSVLGSAELTPRGYKQ